MNGNHKARITLTVGVLVAAEFGVGLGMTSQPSFTLEPTIAFTSTRDNTSLMPLAQGLEIYLTELDGVTNLRRLTSNEHQDTFPGLSPDGKKLTFDSNRLRVAGEQINISDLWVMDADGSSADSARQARRLVELGSGQQERRVPRLGRGRRHTHQTQRHRFRVERQRHLHAEPRRLHRWREWRVEYHERSIPHRRRSRLVARWLADRVYQPLHSRHGTGLRNGGDLER